MKIFNTLTREKQDFITLHENEARIYVCGPTVYNFIHIGNARPLCVFDTLRRYLEWRGMKVVFVQNFTDIDDKIIRRANEEGIDFLAVSEKYIGEFKTDAAGLNVREASYHPRATETIDEIIGIVSDLIENGYAYESNGDVYFRAGKFNEYGKLSHLPLDELEAGARIDVSEVKENAVDFALWKAAKPGEPFWESPWGKGRPGWHIECSAMARKFLGETIDLHCGGQDLIFPHHENEIAQSECANGCEFARYWMHNGYINVDNRKMSKSLGNFFTVRDVAAQYGYEPIRFLMISSHYRSPINYSVEIIEQNIRALDRLYNCRDALKFALQNAQDIAADTDTLSAFEAKKTKFIEEMEDDLNTANAISAVFELVAEINAACIGKQTVSKELCQAALDLLEELCGVLGLLYERKDEQGDDDETARIEALIEERQAARKARDFSRADAIRDELKAEGIILEDTPQGVKWKRA